MGPAAAPPPTGPPAAPAPPRPDADVPSAARDESDLIGRASVHAGSEIVRSVLAGMEVLEVKPDAVRVRVEQSVRLFAQQRIEEVAEAFGRALGRTVGVSIDEGERPPTPPSDARPRQDPAEHPIVQRALSLFGRPIDQSEGDE